MACSSEICMSFCKTPKKNQLPLNQNNTNITHFCQGGIHFCQGGIHFCHGGIHFCQGGIQKALFRLARLCNLCSKHGHPLRVRSPKRVALPMLHVKWMITKDVHHRFPFLNPFPVPEDTACHQWRSSSHLPMQCCVTTYCISSHVFSVSPCGTSSFEFFRFAATLFETVLGRNFFFFF